jgi:hypothetical protein
MEANNDLAKPLPTGMAFKYETAYKQLFDAEPHWRRATIIDEPHGRHSLALAHQAAILAERGEITKLHRESGPMEFDPDYMRKTHPPILGSAPPPDPVISGQL